jgi:transposase InsO family protein
MGNVGKCYDNARMESFFATLKKEKVYQLKTKTMTVEKVKLEVWRYIMIYYNRQRISTVNKGGLPPTKFRESEAKLSELASA